MSWQVGSENLRTQPSQQAGPSLSHNEGLKGVERSAHSNLDWWEDPSENWLLIPSSKRKKRSKFLLKLKSLSGLNASLLPFLSYLWNFFTLIFLLIFVRWGHNQNVWSMFAQQYILLECLKCDFAIPLCLKKKTNAFSHIIFFQVRINLGNNIFEHRANGNEVMTWVWHENVSFNFTDKIFAKTKVME